MTITDAARGLSWGQLPARSWTGSWFTLLGCGLSGLLALAAAVDGLVTGHLRGGRAVAAGLLLYAAALVTAGVAFLLKRATMWHATAGVLLLTPADWFDGWLNSPGRIHLVPWHAVALAVWLLVHRLRWRPPPVPSAPDA